MTSREKSSRGEKEKKKEQKPAKNLTNGELFVQVVRGEDLVGSDSVFDPLIALKVSTDGSKGTKKWSTKASPKTANPIWNEGTSFLIPTNKEDEAKVVATICDDHHSKSYMGEFTFTVAEVKSRENDFANIWFDVVFKKEKEKNEEKKAYGRVLCQIGFISAAQLEGPYQIIQRNADVLVNVLFWDDPWYSLIHALGKSYLSEKMASGIVACALQFECALPLVFSLIKREVVPSIQESTLFRTDSICVKIMRSLFKQVARGFARATLMSAVQNVLNKPEEFDLDFDEGEGEEGKEKSPEEQKQIRKKLFEEIVGFLEHLSSQLSTLPPLVSSALTIVRRVVTEVFPKSAKASVGGFFFLRFLCPAMVSPETIDLIVESPNRQARRVLTLMSKLIQHMSNGTVLKESNVQMKDLNTFIVEHTPKVQGILDKISEAVDELPKTDGETNPFVEGMDKSLSREKIDSVSTHLTLFLHHLRDNSTKVKKDLQTDILATSAIVPSQRVQTNIDVVNLLSGDLELANQITRYLQTEKRHESYSEIGLSSGESVSYESQTVLFKGNGSWCGKIVITDQHRLLSVVKFFEYNKVEQFPLATFLHDATSQKTNSFFYHSDGKKPTTITFQTPEDFQSCLSSLNAAIALSDSPSLLTSSSSSSSLASSDCGEGEGGRGGLKSSVCVSQTRDQCLRPYDWDQILSLASAKYFSAWNVICEGGNSVSGLFQVVEGSVAVLKEGGGKEVMGSLLPMDVYGLVSFIDFAPAKLSLAAGEGGVMVAGLEAKDLLKMFKQDHVLASKFYTYIALSLSKNLTMLTKRAAAAKKAKPAGGGAKGEKKEKKGDEGEEKEESVVVSAVLCQKRRDAHGHFTVYNTHAAFLSKVFGSKIEVLIDYVALRAKQVTLSVLVVKGKKRLQMKGEEGQTFIFKTDDPQSLIDLIQAQAAKGLKAQGAGRSGSVVDLGEKHETMSATDWDFLLTDGSKNMKFKKDEPCLVEGDIQNNLYQITSGSVRIEKGGNVVAKLGQGSIFGELAFLQWYSDGTEAKASANVIADARKVEMVMLDGKFVSGALAKNARLRSCFFVYISQLIVDRLRKTLEMTYGE